MPIRENFTLKFCIIRLILCSHLIFQLKKIALSINYATIYSNFINKSSESNKYPGFYKELPLQCTLIKSIINIIEKEIQKLSF